jgi:hypothetical protein
MSTANLKWAVLKAPEKTVSLKQKKMILVFLRNEISE